MTLDEGAFQRLLSAAFVIQEHNDSLKNQTPDPAEFKASDLSEIAETQNLIRGKRLDLLTAAAVIVERSQKISHAAAGAIALLSKRELSYISSSGVAAPSVGTTVTLDESLSAECVRTGQFLLVPNLKTVVRSQAELFLSRGMLSFASVPIYQEQQIAGVMELFFNRPNAIDATTLRTCQLLAGLLTGTIASQPTIQPPVIQSQIIQPSIIQRPDPIPTLPPPPLDQFKPQLDRAFEAEDPDVLPELLRDIVQGPAASHEKGSGSSGGRSTETPSGANDRAGTEQSQPPIVRCRKCGCPFEDEESFCGLCGTARGAASEHRTVELPKAVPPQPEAPRTTNPTTPTPAPTAPLSELLPEPAAGPPDVPEKSEALPPELQEILARFPAEPEIIPPTPSTATSASAKIFDPGPMNLAISSIPPTKDAQSQPAPAKSKPSEQKTPETSLTAPKQPSTAPATAIQSQAPPADTPANPQWKSASETRAWLESVKVPSQRKHWMADHRANLYLAAAAVLLLLVLFGVGMPAELQSGKPQLGWFDSMLVNLGLAEAPSTTVYLGNPTTKVWVDMHTALYYCPDADLYGKTRGGKFETQREAQQDQFQPASRHACP